MSLTSSSRTRSAETMVMRSASCSIASAVASSMRKPSWATKRTARIIRSGSSLKDWAGATGVRSRVRARSSSPPKGSTSSSEGRRTAIALTVKSRRERSPSRVSPYSTCGLRLAGS